MTTSKKYALHPHENAGPGNFRDAVVEAAKLLGWRVYWTHNSKHSPAGYLDMTLVRPPRLIVAELKVKGRKMTPAQEAWFADLSEVPAVEVYLWTPDDWPAITETLRKGP